LALKGVGDNCIGPIEGDIYFFASSLFKYWYLNSTYIDLLFVDPVVETDAIKRKIDIYKKNMQQDNSDNKMDKNRTNSNRISSSVAANTSKAASKLKFNSFISAVYILCDKVLEFWKSMVIFATKQVNEFRNRISDKIVLIDFNFIFASFFIFAFLCLLTFIFILILV
jgi:hypothetical protein